MSKIKTVDSTAKNIPASLSRHLVGMFILYALPVLAVVGFFDLADEVGEGDTLPYDNLVLTTIHSLSTPWLDTATKTFTELGGPVVLPIIVLIIGSVLFLKGKTRQGLLLGVGVAGASALNILLKIVYQRDRPNLWQQIIVEHSHSFPSGHAMATSALAAAIILITWQTKWRIKAATASILFVLIIGFTRLYLGVHYPTDIIAGWVAGTAWVVGVWFLLKKTRFTRSQNTNQ